MRHDIVHPTTAIMNLFDRQEQRVILELSEETGLSPQNVLRQALKMYQLAQVGDVNLPPKKLYDDSDSLMAALSFIVEDGYATDTQRATAKAAIAEIERLREGEFSDEEFQHLCHCIPETDREAFFTGCAEYQRKLFGSADRDRLVKILREVKRALNQLDKEVLGRDQVHGHYYVDELLTNIQKAIDKS